VIAVSGGPRERGRAYGEGARERVHRTLSLYEQLIGYHTGLRWDRIRDLAAPFVEPIDAYDERLLPEFEGIAEGAGVDAEDILAVNLRTELLSAGPRHGARPSECTAVCVAPTPDTTGHVLIGQNWDWTPRAASTCVVLDADPHDGPRSVTLVEAGLLAKCGANAAGIGVAANALDSSRDRGQTGVPFHAILRRILTSSTFEEAEEAVMGPDRASSGNYLIASADGRSVDLEAAPGGREAVARFDGPRLAHTNHFLAKRAGFKDMSLLEPASTSRHRYASASGSLESLANPSVDQVATLLRDHDGLPGSVCKHRNDAVVEWDDSVTIAAMAADLTEPTVWISEGPPCVAEMEAFSVR
jgi:isopenicillin-N N-acyltransferase like protein